MKRIKKLLFSSELYFALFLYAGVFKESIKLPIDLAAVFLLLTCVLMMINIYRKGVLNKTFLVLTTVLFTIVGYILLNFIFTSGNAYFADKLIKFILLTIPTIVLTVLILNSKESVHKFYVSIVLITITIALILVPSLIARGTNIGFIGISGGNYQGVARLLGAGLVIAIFYFLLIETNLKKKAIMLIASLLILTVLLGTGSRMPILGVILASTYIAFQLVLLKSGVIYLRKGVKNLIPFVITLGLVIPIIIQKGVLQTIIYRFIVLFTENGGGTSTLGRIERFDTALDMLKSAPFLGTGLGSFSVYYGNREYDYPHNLILEISSELGLLGLLLFLSIIFFSAIFSFTNIRKKKLTTIGMVTIGLLIYHLSNAMVSGDINSNRILYVFIILLYFLPILNIDTDKNRKSGVING